MNAPKPLAEFFSFSRKDRIIVFLFVSLLAALAIVPRFFPQRQSSMVAIPDSLWLRPAPVSDSMEDMADAHQDIYAPSWRPTDAWRTASLFSFDPNMLDEAGWKKLGLPDRNIRTILKYREKGGRFRKPEDLAKIWSLPAGFVERVLPYVRIADEVRTTTFTPTRYPERQAYVPKARAVASIGINDGDSAAWEALPGIGAKLAGRITRFRERLGGFQSVEQVAETFGLPDSTFRKIQPYLTFNGGGASIRKLNLNTATKEELKAHPYIRWNLANAIVEYRNRHGNFSSVGDLKKLVLVTDSAFKKLENYLSVD
jgi:competence protein ComEA